MVAYLDEPIVEEAGLSQDLNFPNWVVGSMNGLLIIVQASCQAEGCESKVYAE